MNRKQRIRTLGLIMALVLITGSAFVVQPAAKTEYAGYDGLDYAAIVREKGLDERIITILDKARDMCTVKWTAPCDFYTWWARGDKEYNIVDELDHFAAGKNYIGIPYTMNMNVYELRNRKQNRFDDLLWMEYISSHSKRSDYEFDERGAKTSCGVGVDCSGLVQCAYEAAGLNLADLSTGGIGGFAHLSTNKAYWDDLHPGDILSVSNKDHKHMLLVVGMTDKDTVAVFEATPPISKYSNYKKEDLKTLGYKPYRFDFGEPLVVDEAYGRNVSCRPIHSGNTAVYDCFGEKVNGHYVSYGDECILIEAYTCGRFKLDYPGANGNRVTSYYGQLSDFEIDGMKANPPHQEPAPYGEGQAEPLGEGFSTAQGAIDAPPISTEVDEDTKTAFEDSGTPGIPGPDDWALSWEEGYDDSGSWDSETDASDRSDIVQDPGTVGTPQGTVPADGSSGGDVPSGQTAGEEGRYGVDEPSAPRESPFNDVSVDDSFFDAINRMYERGIINGMGNGNYMPEKILSRAEAATLLCKLYGRSALSPTETEFTDVGSSHWASGYIDFCCRTAKLVNGYGDGRFGPDDNLTLRQFAKILVCAVGLGEQAERNGGWKADAYTQIALETGILNDVRFSDVNDPLPRRYAAVMMDNLYTFFGYVIEQLPASFG